MAQNIVAASDIPKATNKKRDVFRIDNVYYDTSRMA
eukprot:CAMPEP_0176452524 /NCGR_PEP_ID=MMETSP0127-20121128/28589_1 /TAXON_ID=938130 /ORGANISM="Platyophrya macrostoma, Strain WH" /LENGTH=35 /DNA_ID= /DNA_START= /DNA_END= /DNA_ORIENTATION=